ncbi:hypothetical protein FKW77_002912 [Venturia effusa]|uniref:Uncharacterized protein n=1 Tax=Venturia effusa TaxID=50376 RepID=A0A517L2V3_9PEZI|nr:hypothetical protein FKW77_002912 [Venturia effusa]
MLSRVESYIVDTDVHGPTDGESSMEGPRLQSRADTLQQSQPQTGLATLPTELVDCIFEYVASPQSLFPFLFSRTLHDSAVRVLYQDLRIEVCSAMQWNDGSATHDLAKGAVLRSSSKALDVFSLIAPKLRRMDLLVDAHMASLTENEEKEQSKQLRSPSLLTMSRSISAAFFTDQFIQELAALRVFVDNAFVKDLELELGPSTWGGWLNKILQKAPDTRSLACDVLPGMWGNDVTESRATALDTTQDKECLVDGRHLRSSSMQNLHTLSLRGFHGYILKLQLSTVPNLRTLKLLNIQIHQQIGLNGITEVEESHTIAPRNANFANGITIRSNYHCFPKLRTYRSIILPPATIRTRHHIHAYLSMLRTSADNLKSLELMTLGRWDFEVNHTAVFGKPFKNLTTLRVPSIKLVHLRSLNPELGVDPLTIRRIEVIVHYDCADGLFKHLLMDVVTGAVRSLKPHFSNLAVVKVALADTAGKNLCRGVELFLTMMAHIVGRGAFMENSVVKASLDIFADPEYCKAAKDLRDNWATKYKNHGSLALADHFDKHRLGVSLGKQQVERDMVAMGIWQNVEEGRLDQSRDPAQAAQEVERASPTTLGSPSSRQPAQSLRRTARKAAPTMKRLQWKQSIKEGKKAVKNEAANRSAQVQPKPSSGRQQRQSDSANDYVVSYNGGTKIILKRRH